MTQTDTGRALLRAILTNPADDTVRMMYADYLEENGQPDRAEFIRVQVELTRRTRPAKVHTGPGRRMLLYDHGEDYDILQRRERELIDGPVCRRCDWHSPLPHGGTEWTYRRGFVAEIRCPLATLFGWPCRRCGGDGDARGASRVFPGTDCPDCHGTGTVPGCAAELFASHPVERVMLTDCDPAALMDSTAWGWQVSESTRPENPWWVGPRFRPHLLAAGAKTVSYAGRQSDWVWFDTADQAHDALSRAAVGLGRELAGLPPLP